MDPGLPVKRYRFGDYLLEAREARLLRAGADLGVQPKVIELLQTFVAQPGHLFTRADLRRLLWPDVHVSDHSLSQVLHKARQALADGQATEWIQTVHRKGYRFVGPVVTEVEDHVPDRVGRDRFVGREAELAALAALWARKPAGVALVGTGGAGKTRLAREHAERFRGPWGWRAAVDVAAVRSTPTLIGAVAGAVGVGLAATDGARALDHLGRARAHRGEGLILLDNLEGALPEAASALARWRTLAPGVRWLVTSRVRVGVDGIDEYEVPPLSDADAIELFRLRAREQAIDLGAGWNDEIRRVARALDGSALGIELAAARTPLLDPAAIRSRLDHQLDVLSSTRDVPARHRSMRAAVAWSWELASEAERQVLCHLALFAGPFTVAQAERVARAGPEAPLLDVLQSLSDRFLLEAGARVDARPGRLRIPPPVREFAVEHLDGDDPARARFVTAMVARAHDADAVTERWDADAHAALLDDLDHLRAAMDEARDDPAARARLAIGVAQTLWAAGRGVEAREVVDSVSDPRGLDPIRADELLYWRATSDSFLKLASPHTDALSHVIDRALTRGDRAFASRCAERRAEALALAGRHAEALAEGLRALDLGADAGDLARVAMAAYRAAVPTMFLGNLDEGRNLVRRGLAAAEAAGDVRIRSVLLDLRGALALRSGQFDDAARDYAASIATAEQHRFMGNEHNTLTNLASAHQEAGRFAEALRIQLDLDQRLVRAGRWQERGAVAVNRGLTRLHLGDLDGAGADLQAAATLAKPGSQMRHLADMNLAALAALRGRWDEARALARATADACAGAPIMVSAALLWLVVAHAGRGDLRAAREAEAEAASQGPLPPLVEHSHAVTSALIDALEARGRGDAAGERDAIARIDHHADAPVHALVALVARACRGVLGP